MEDETPVLKPGQLQRMLASLPTESGVYIMRDRSGAVLYVGKARNLRARVRSYFRRSGDNRPFVRRLGRLLHDIEVVLTPTEKDALVLERRLVQQLHPRFNVDLTDDKNFLSLLIGAGEFPRLVLARRRPRATGEHPAGRWYGPYTSSRQARQLLRLVQQAYGLRTCSDRRLAGRSRPCLLYQMGRCSAPCTGLIDQQEYAERVRQAQRFLRGRRREVLQALEQRMQQAAARLDFEVAARLRDRWQAARKALAQQAIVESNRGDVDVVALASQQEQALALIMQVRDGCLLGVTQLPFNLLQAPATDSLRQLLVQHYSSGADVPGRLLVDRLALVGGEGRHDLEALGLWLEQLRGRRVKVHSSTRGTAGRLLEMARRNAGQALQQRLEVQERGRERLLRLQQRLGLGRLPERIECVDLSTTGGRESVGAVSVLLRGQPRPQLYRHYRIRRSPLDDDLQMMREVVQRRLQRLQAEQKPLPDLLLLDGGRGHLRVVADLLAELGVEVELAAIAKGRARRRRGQQIHDEVYRPGRKNPWLVKAGHEELYLLAQARDEAHRFAIGHHRRLRGRGQLNTTLEQVAGVGPVLRRRLLDHFGSLERMSRATPAELLQVRGISARLAGRLQEFLAQQLVCPPGTGESVDRA